MRTIIAAVGLIAAMLTPADADSATMLYDHPPWAVFRVDSPGGPSCLAGVVESDESTFAIFGEKKMTFINLSNPAWQFAEHMASMMLSVDGSGQGPFHAFYSGGGARVLGSREEIYAIMRGLDVAGDGEVEVLGEESNVIATFDITGVGAAVDVWKACVDGL